jgi:hypothetical protein
VASLHRHGGGRTLQQEELSARIKKRYTGTIIFIYELHALNVDTASLMRRSAALFGIWCGNFLEIKIHHFDFESSF